MWRSRQSRIKRCQAHIMTMQDQTMLEKHSPPDTESKSIQPASSEHCGRRRCAFHARSNSAPSATARSHAASVPSMHSSPPLVSFLESALSSQWAGVVRISSTRRLGLSPESSGSAWTPCWLRPLRPEDVRDYPGTGEGIDWARSIALTTEWKAVRCDGRRC